MGTDYVVLDILQEDCLGQGCGHIDLRKPTTIEKAKFCACLLEGQGVTQGEEYMEGTDRSMDMRRRMRQRRLEQSGEKAQEESLRAQEHLRASNIWQKAQSVALYAATRGETDTSLLLAHALLAEKKVFFPRMRKNEKGIMDFVRITSPDELREGAFGILEPAPELSGLGAEDASFDLCVVPGLVFSLAGNRMGYGGGYYDRFFTAARILTRIGLCYSFQIVTPWTAEPWDIPMTHICSEKGLVAADKTQGNPDKSIQE